FPTRSPAGPRSGRPEPFGFAQGRPDAGSPTRPSRRGGGGGKLEQARAGEGALRSPRALGARGGWRPPATAHRWADSVRWPPDSAIAARTRSAVIGRRVTGAPMASATALAMAAAVGTCGVSPMPLALKGPGPVSTFTLIVSRAGTSGIVGSL